jgi:(p)ppGpp synthase/HD superfamily hydrolase
MSFHHPDPAELTERAENERHWRLLMDADPQSHAKEILLSTLQARLGEGAPIPSLLSQALEWAFKIEYQHGSVAPAVYLNHPLRVATILAKTLDIIDDETLTIAILHNVLEVSEISKQELNDALGSNVAEAIDTLTVDRTRQHDASYKNNYYVRIEALSPACARVKIADKLDNIYMLCFNSSEITRKSYLDEIDRWVIPMAERVIPVLAERMKEASAAMRMIGFLDKETELGRAKEKDLS